jgi:hypothetical protein
VESRPVAISFAEESLDDRSLLDNSMDMVTHMAQKRANWQTLCELCVTDFVFRKNLQLEVRTCTFREDSFFEMIFKKQSLQ